MEIALDTHTHTLASGHAYSTLMENARAAKQNAMEAIGMTDHTPPLEDAPHILHFMNLHVLGPLVEEVRIFRGAELNICDFEGSLGIPESVLAYLDYTIASFHEPVLQSGSKAQNTAAYLAAMENPHVNIIGHPDDGHIPIDFEQLVLGAKASSTLLEVNNSSLRAAYYRLNTRENISIMLKLCEKHGVAVSLGSDAHFASAVGRFDEALALLEEISFPEELVANTSVEKFCALLARKTGCV